MDRRLALVLGLSLSVVAPAARPGGAVTTIRLGREAEGIRNLFLRSRSGTVHALASRLPRLRVVLAIPEQNTGLGLWLDSGEQGEGPPGIHFDGGIRHGRRGGRSWFRTRLEVDAPELRLERLLLGSVRTLRDYVHTSAVPRRETLLRAREMASGEALRELRERIDAWDEPPRRSGASLLLARPTLDGRSRLEARLTPSRGTRLEQRDGEWMLTSAERCRFTLSISHDLPRLTPLNPEELLSPAATRVLESLARVADDTHARLDRQRRELSLLAYEDRFLAGSWRFLTYFGRDTMLTLRMMEPVLSTTALRAGLRSVLWRLSPEGMVAHEEDLGDQAVLDRLSENLSSGGSAATRGLRLRRERKRLGEPVLDYKMVDDDLMLAGLARAVLSRLSREERADFLAERGPDGSSNRTRLLRNLEYLLGRLEGPLIGLREELSVGDWRDSEAGLGYRPHAYSVNAALPEGAARSLGELLDGDLLGGREELLGEIRRLDLSRLLVMLEAGVPGRVEVLRRSWRDRREAFRVELGVDEVRDRLRAFLASLEEPVRRSLVQAPLPGGKTLGEMVDGAAAPFGARYSFPALALDGAEQPLAVMQSDPALLLLDVPPWELDTRELEEIFRVFRLPYPLGLWTPAGFVVANPALSGSEEEWARFDRHAYHGSVVWGWQVALLEAVLLRWKDDPRLTSPARELWVDMLARLRALDGPLQGIRHEELWTWKVDGDGRVQPVPYGVEAESATESNALQLWSLVPLANELVRLGAGP